MRFPTGGIAHEPIVVTRSMIRCNSEADSIVWMKEDESYNVFVRSFMMISSGMIFISELFLMDCMFHRIQSIEELYLSES